MAAHTTKTKIYASALVIIVQLHCIHTIAPNCASHHSAGTVITATPAPFTSPCCAGGVPATVEAMISHMGMYVAEGTDLVAANARSHMLMLSGELCGGHKALLRISFGLDPQGATVMKVVTRAAEKEISEVLDEIVQSV